MSSFWGVEVKPGRPYTHRPENGEGKIRITQATLGSGSATKKSTVQCNVGDKSPIFICILYPEKTESCPLHLEFEGDDEVTFSVIGPRSVHLSGFSTITDRNYDRDDDSLGEDIADTETDSSDYDSEDEFDDDFIDDGDDDLEMFPSHPFRNSRVVIEEILEDEKTTNEKSQPKKLDNKDKLQKSKDDNISPSEQKIVLKNGSSVQVLESEDEDGFPIQMAETETEELEDKRTEEAKRKNKNKKNKTPTKNDNGSLRVPKRKTDNLPDGSESERKMKKKTIKENDKLAIASKNSEICEEDDIRSVNANTTNIDDDRPLGNKPDEMNPNSETFHVAAENHQLEKKKKKKKKNKKAKAQFFGGDAEKEQAVSATDPMESEEKIKGHPSHAKTFGNGLVVEDIAMGKPDGKKASLGKKVSVHYIGKLRSNGKIFDSSIGKAPFKFRLGVNQVIKGWDVGIQGMRVGDKRRLTIPPAMAYGDKRLGPIPQNSWLLFEVELVDVQ